MKKYLYIYKSELMTNLQYLFNLISLYITYIIFIFTFQSLWKFVYSDPAQLINGYSISDMIWYITATEIIVLTTKGRQIITLISTEIKSGTIAYNLTKPFDYIKYHLFLNLGKCTPKFIIFIALGAIVGFLFVGTLPDINILEFILVIIIAILGLVINILILIALGLISFNIEDSTPLYWVYSKMILVFGTLFPIEFFKGILGKILTFSPIFVITYGPAKLLLDFSYNEFIKILASQFVYIIIMYIICQIMLKRGGRKLSVNGG